MEKDFQRWHKKKAAIHHKRSTPFFYEREIWWCSLGVNIGFEQDGKGKVFSRPVIILKKFNEHVLLILPLTTRKKTGRYYYRLSSFVGNRRATAVLSQLRLVDAKRLIDKLGSVPKSDFQKIRKAVGEFFA